MNTLFFVVCSLPLPSRVIPPPEPACPAVQVVFNFVMGHVLLTWFFACCWALVIAGSAVEIGIRALPVGSLAIDAFVDQTSLPDAQPRHREVMDFYYASGELSPARWSEREVGHLADVRGVLDGIRWTTFGCLLLAVAGLIGQGEQRWWGPRRGAVLVLGGLGALAVIASQWSLFSRGLHPVLFPQGNWDFVPGKHRLIDLYDQPVLGAYAGAILALALLVALALWGLCRWRSRAGIAWSWQASRHQWWLLLGLPLVGWYAWLGYGMRTIGDAGYIAFWLIAGGMLAVVLQAMFWRDKSWSALVLALILACWLAQALAVRQASRDALASVQGGGAALQTTIEAYRQQLGRPPAALHELIGHGLEAIPSVQGGGPWYYQRRGRHYILGFDGPLQFAHEYVSWRGTWNLLNWAGWP